MTMSDARRAEIIANYPATVATKPPDPSQNAIVQTIIRIERLEAQAFPSRGTDDYTANLFDPSRSPRMHQIAADAHREMKIGIANGTIELFGADGSAEPESALQVYFVGSGQVRTCKPGRAADRLGRFLRITDAIHTEAGAFQCAIRVAPDCGGADTSTMLMPLLYGGVLLVFECCGLCHSTARELAEVGYRVGEIAAYERALAMAPQQPASRSGPTTATPTIWWARVWRWLRGPA